MQKLRIWILIVLAWFFVLLNIERFHEPINISTFVYVLAMILSLGVVAIPPMHDRTTGVLAAGALAIFLLLKLALGYQVAGQMLPITITEAFAICFSVLVTHRLAWSIRQFEQSVLELNGLINVNEGMDFDGLQDGIYREVRRARNFKRPLSIVAINAPLNVEDSALDQLIAEVQRSTKLQYLQARLIELIGSDLNDSDILSIRDGKFLLVLTEADRSRAEEISRKVIARIEKFVGRPVKSGIASFPDDEITLTGLLSRADAELELPDNFRQNQDSELIAS